MGPPFGRGHRRRREHLKDFWRDWQEERQRLWEELGGHGAPPGPPGPPGPGGHGHPPHRGEPGERGWPAERPPWAGMPGWAPGMPTPPSVGRAFHRLFSEFMGVEPENHWAFGGRRFTPWHQGVDSFNPFVASLLSKGGGLLPLLVMHFLSDRPRYGNEIMEMISEWTRGQWVPNPGAIYPLMDELEENHLIRGEWEDPDKRTVRIYQLTDEGQQELQRVKAIVQPKLKECIRVLTFMADGLGNGSSEGETNETSAGDAPAGDDEPDQSI
jgi:PadR family transcriptional regulator PadR